MGYIFMVGGSHPNEPACPLQGPRKRQLLTGKQMASRCRKRQTGCVRAPALGCIIFPFTRPLSHTRTHTPTDQILLHHRKWNGKHCSTKNCQRSRETRASGVFAYVQYFRLLLLCNFHRKWGCFFLVKKQQPPVSLPLFAPIQNVHVN